MYEIREDGNIIITTATNGTIMIHELNRMAQIGVVDINHKTVEKVKNLTTNTNNMLVYGSAKLLYVKRSCGDIIIRPRLGCEKETLDPSIIIGMVMSVQR